MGDQYDGSGGAPPGLDEMFADADAMLAAAEVCRTSARHVRDVRDRVNDSGFIPRGAWGGLKELILSLGGELIDLDQSYTQIWSSTTERLNAIAKRLDDIAEGVVDANATFQNADGDNSGLIGGAGND